MLRFRVSKLVCLFSVLGCLGGSAQGQQQIGFIEKFALAEDRREALSELIPGTDEYYYFHCLHYQNERQLGESQAILDAWRAKFGDTQQVRNMVARQRLLTYAENPQQTLDYLRTELGLNLSHAPPSRNRAATLPNALDNSQLEVAKLLESAIAADRSLGLIETDALQLVLDRGLAPDQLRAVIGRLERADLTGVIKRIAEELAYKDSRGFGWANVHALLTLTQLNELLGLQPSLLEDDAFVRGYTARLAPAEGSSLSVKQELRRYLQRLLAWSRRLPPSQNSFKALVIGNLLRLDMSERKYDRELFLEYLSLPRSAPYYESARLRNQSVGIVKLDFTMNPQAALPAMGDDSGLVRRYLEHFLQSDDNVDAFAPYLNRRYLELVLAETKILYGLGDEAVWYSKLSPGDQKELRERIELRFAPYNQSHYVPDDSVRLDVELKNVQQLTINIFEIDTLGFYRNSQEPISTAIDLDGLIPNVQLRREFSQPAQRRHVETIDLPQLTGRGTWVVDLLGGGQRSRALVQKGRLVALERLGDAGHAFQIIDSQGRAVDSAHIELAGRTYAMNEQGRIIVPYAEQTVTRNLLLVDGDYATPWMIQHNAETYQLEAGFLLDRQSLVAGTQATVAIRLRLACNDRPISIQLLENPQLTIVATDAEGVSTTQSIANLDLEDGDELVHTFLVPQQLASLSMTITGKVYNQNRDRRDEVSASQSLACNGIDQSNQIGDFFLRKTPRGARLMVLGRNGEPIPKLPVLVSLKLRQFKNQRTFTLATNQAGIIELGQIENVSTVSVSASGIQTTSYSLSDFHRDWPNVIHIGRDETVELPLGKESAEKKQFALQELRRGSQYASHPESLHMTKGGLTISDLSPGDYLLRDYETGQQVRILVGDAEQGDQYVAAPYRLLQSRRRAPLIVRHAKLENGQLVIRVSGADAMTRVHVIADAFAPDVASGHQLHLPHAPLRQRQLQPIASLYVDSIRLDEEFTYILERQGLTKFPGNMLTQPSVLVQPWEVSVTENLSKQAAAGDALPDLAEPTADARGRRADSKRKAKAARPDWKSFDFLDGGSVVIANLGLVDGAVSLPADAFAGFSCVTVVAVHPTTSDSRQVILEDSPLQTRDQRLRESFDSGIHLAQVQKVELLEAGQKKVLGDPKTRRMQVYTTVADVFQLYSTILNDPNWEKFRFIGRWQDLTEEEQLERYNAMGCHELNFFLYHKDRKFFDRIVKPLIAHKLDKQLVDLWLLSESLGSFDELWKVRRLNTLERILLADRLAANQDGTKRWLAEYLQTHPLDPEWRQQRFEVALRGSALQAAGESINANLNFSSLSAFEAMDAAMPAAPMSAGRGGEARQLGGNARGLRRAGIAKSSGKEEAEQLSERAFFGVDRLVRGQQANRFFQSLDKTREWAEAQYYRVRLQDQTPELVLPNAFWEELLAANGQPFLSHNLDLPCQSINEALCALAVIDLPFASEPPELTIEEEQLVLACESPAVVFLESIEASQQPAENASILAGQDIYLAAPGTDDDANLPLGEAPLLTGLPYRASVVVTNPSSNKQRVQVLTQLPAGSLPLSGSKMTRGTSLDLEPYSTAQVQYSFYFPAAGDFEHYGAQISSQARHITQTSSKALRVTAEPESVDENTWSYVADWGSNEQVLSFLRKANLQSLDLSRIAFRMSDRTFYERVVQLLSASGMYEPQLWAYSVAHDARDGIQQLLQHRPDFLARLGVVFESPLVQVAPGEQMSYEHLDYRPLVVARMHRLGRQAVILNPSLHQQYQALLDVLSHQPSVNHPQRLQLCYYLLLQNRIDEALTWFAQADRAQLASQLQYDYFDAYLDFYRGRYARAASLAQKYADYPVPRWAELFQQVGQQVATRNALLSGQQPTFGGSEQQSSDSSQRILTDRRSQQQTQQAASTPTLDLELRDGRLAIRFNNLKSVQINYYLMDIELLFSRNPFVAREGASVPPIRPNLSQSIDLDSPAGLQELKLPQQLRNRNVLVEVTAAGISRSRVMTASALAVNVVEPYGQLQVLSQERKAPLEATYVKVFARHQDGSIRFYKDGYTDLRGQFDYATLSTSDLDSAERFAILVLHPELGAVVKEAATPTR